MVHNRLVYNEELSDVGRFLTLSINESTKMKEPKLFDELYRNLGFDICWKEAERNQIKPFVAYSICEMIPSDTMNDPWNDLLERNKSRVHKLYSALLKVAAQFEKFSIKWAVIENAGIMFGSNLPMATFCAGDFDLVVEEGRWDDVNRAFANVGFELNSRRNRNTSRREYKCELDSGEVLWLNACSVPFERIWLPIEYKNRTQDWLQRRITSPRYPEIYILSPEDALTWVAIHTSMHSYVRSPGLRLHVDVDRCVRDNDIDWDLFLYEVHAVGLPTRVFVSLSMAVGLLQTPIPDSVLEALYPGDSRSKQISHLLSQEGVCVSSKKKLPPEKTLTLDALLNEQGKLSWAKNIVLPSSSWLKNQFYSTEESNKPLWQLQLGRYKRLISNWRPE